MRALRLLVITLTAALFPLFGQLALEQKEHDFRNLAALYAKRYAPAAWKKQLLGVDILDLGPWMDRVRASKDDLEFMEICYQYVASFQDIHSSFAMTSNFVADSGLFVDIYDGKVLIEAVNTLTLPPARFPIRVGDEILAVGGKPVAQLLEEFAKLRGMGNPLTARRNAADRIVFRPQSAVPRAAELPAESAFQILHQTGVTATYNIPWTKTGIPITKIGPAPTPEFVTPKGVQARTAAADTEPSYMKPMRDAQNWTLPDTGLHVRNWGTSAWAREPASELDSAATPEPEGYVLGLGSRFPAFSPLPNFTIRRGLAATDFHLSFTYEAGGKRIGYIRVPSFSPASTAAATAELAAEIAFFQQNTDGLVVDVMRNPGGGCYMLTLASYLIPQPFFFFGEYRRPTADLISAYSNALQAARTARAEQWVIDYYQFYLDLLQKAYAEGRGLTGSIPSCSLTFENQPARSATGALLAYTKPLIVLIDEYSISAADIFPAMIQDNKRGPLVGTRTSGGGGSISAWTTGFYSESAATNTNTLVIRKDNVRVPGYPVVPYVENLGAHADIYLNYMTKDNLLQAGRPFVLDFTGAIVTEILKAGQ